MDLFFKNSFKSILKYVSYYILINLNIVLGQTISSINGVVSSDSLVTILGSSFGESSLNIEWIGQHIEEANYGDEFSKQGWSIMPFPQFKAYYDTSNEYSGSKSIIFDSSNDEPFGNDDGRAGISYDWGSNLDFAYASWWAYIDLNSVEGQWKMFRMCWQNQVYDTGPEIVMFNWFSGTAGKQFIVRRSAGEKEQRWYLNASDYPQASEWVRLELYMKPSSSAGEADCEIDFWLHRPGTSILNPVHQSGLISYANGETDEWRYFIFQNYLGNGTFPGAKVWMDDIYLSDTKARVEIGDKQSYSDCTFREIQYPMEWEDSRIEILVNTGGYDFGYQAYLFIIDEDGRVNNNGYPIVIGRNYDAPAPPVWYPSSESNPQKVDND